MPRVTIIIPNYNHAVFLPERIDSVLQQTVQDFELILLDDASEDHSVALLEEYAQKDDRISFYPNAENSGSPFAQWNKGVALARADLIWIAESDDACAPTFLEEVLPRLEDDPRVGIAYCQSDLVNESGTLINNYLTNLEYIYKSDHWQQDFTRGGEAVCREWLLFHNPIPNASGCVMRKEAYTGCGGADPAMRLNGDWYLYTKILSRWNLSFTAQTLNYFRVHDRTQRARTRTTYKVYDEILEINHYIRNYIPASDAPADEALKKVATWWTGSLPYQRWNRESLRANLRLFRTFSQYRKWVLLEIIYTFGFVIIRRLLRMLGIIKGAKRLRSFLFPGKYFPH